MNYKMMMASVLLTIACSSNFAQDQVAEICNQLSSDEQKKVLCEKITQLQDEATLKAQQIQELQAGVTVLPRYAINLIALFSDFLIFINNDINLRRVADRNLRILAGGVMGGVYVVSLTGKSLLKDIFCAISSGVFGAILLELSRRIDYRRY